MNKVQVNRDNNLDLVTVKKFGEGYIVDEKFRTFQEI